MTEKLPVVARLYYAGSGCRRHLRASTHEGPGEPLCFVSVAQEWLRRERAKQQALSQLLLRTADKLRRVTQQDDCDDEVKALLRDCKLLLSQEINDQDASSSGEGNA